MSQGDDSQDYTPSVADVDEFNQWLCAENFEIIPESINSIFPEVCKEWLRGHERQVRLWIYKFWRRRGVKEFERTLGEILDELTDLYTGLDRLFGPLSYPALNPLPISGEQRNLFEQNLSGTYRNLDNMLREYVLYARAYKKRHEASELLDTSPMKRDPVTLDEEIEKEFGVIVNLLQNLANTVTAEPRLGSARQTPDPRGRTGAA
jgi:hypothetical protein